MGNSKAVYLLLPAVFLLVGLMSVSVAFAANAVKGQADVVAKVTDVVAGQSSLVRNANGISFSVETSMLEPGHAFTVWIKVYEPNDKTIVLFGAGGTSDGKGKLHLKGGLPTGPVVTDDGDGVFNTPFTATITLKIRDHGPIIEDLVDEQTSTKNGGCQQQSDSAQDFWCTTVQVAVHTP